LHDQTTHAHGPLEARLGSPPPRRVVVLRALRGLGDLLCTVPALRALRAALPDAHVTLIGLPDTRWFVDRFPRYIDELLEFPGYPGIPEQPVEASRLLAFLSEAHARPFDLAIQLQGNGLVSNGFIALLGARHTAGFTLPGLYRPEDGRFLDYPATDPEPDRHLRLMEFLGVPSQGRTLEWPLTGADRAEFAAAPDLAALPPGSYACVHPGARDPLRRWPAARFAAVADRLAARGLLPVLTGTEDERVLVSDVSSRMRAAHVDACGRLSLGAMGLLLARSRLLVSNDTGVSHLAAALDVPSVVVFSASDRRRWAPLDARLHRAVGDGVSDEQPCPACLGEASRCLRDGCTLASRLAPRSAVLAPVDDVIAAAEALLDG
jgi:ADP-heptose:LPS heptosyltransferase